MSESINVFNEAMDNKNNNDVIFNELETNVSSKKTFRNKNNNKNNNNKSLKNNINDMCLDKHPSAIHQPSFKTTRPPSGVRHVLHFRNNKNLDKEINGLANEADSFIPPNKFIDTHSVATKTTLPLSDVKDAVNQPFLEQLTHLQTIGPSTIKKDVYNRNNINNN